MCDYRAESKRELNALPVPVRQLKDAYGSRAVRPLRQALRAGRLAPGNDLDTGEPLSRDEVRRGHYLTPPNFERFLNRLNRRPEICPWCGGRLPAENVRQHQRPHDHREEIRHHFHPECFGARLVGVAVVFGHVRPEEFGERGLPARRALPPAREKTAYRG